MKEETLDEQVALFNAAAEAERAADPRNEIIRDPVLKRQRVRDVIDAGADVDRDYLIAVLVGEGTADEFILPLLDRWTGRRYPEISDEDLAARAVENAEAVTAYRADQARRAENRAKGEWEDPEPLPNTLRPVPAFDYTMLPDACAAFVKDTAERMQCPPDYVAAPLLAALGSVIGRQCVIYPKVEDDWNEVPNLWALNIGEPGELKTPASEAALAPLVRLEAAALAEYDAAEGVRAFEALKRDGEMTELEKQIKGKKAAPGEAVYDEAGAQARFLQLREAADAANAGARRFVVNDATVEKLGMILNENTNGVTQRRDELIGWLNLMDRDGHENDRAFYNEAWNGKNPYVYDRVERGTLRIDAACVSVIGNIPPGPLRQHLHHVFGNGETNDGMIQRFQLMVWPDRKANWVNVDRWPNTVARTRLFEIFSRLANLDAAAFGVTTPEAGLPFLRFTPEAQALFNRWRQTFERSLDDPSNPVLVAHFTKYRSLLPVLALIVHLTECAATNGSGPVTAEAVNRAILWVAYLAEHARRVYAALTERTETVAGEIATRLQAGAIDPRDTFTARDIARKDWRGVGHDMDDIRDGLRLLQELGWVRGRDRDPGAKGGRVTVDYKVNPLVLRRNQGGRP